MHYSWKIDIERERKTRKKSTILSLACCTSFNCSILLQYFLFSLFFFAPIRAIVGTEKVQEEVVEKQEQKKPHSPKSIHFWFVYFCLFISGSASYRVDCTAAMHVKVYVHIACEKKTNMIYCLQKCDNRNSCIASIQIGISTSSSSSSSSSSRFCNREIHSSQSRCNAISLTRKWIFWSNLSLCNEF